MFPYWLEQLVLVQPWVVEQFHATGRRYISSRLGSLVETPVIGMCSVSIQSVTARSVSDKCLSLVSAIEKVFRNSS